MLGALTTLLLFQLAGEVLVQLLSWPIPGPVIGMALLFIMLVLRSEAPAALRQGALGLLQHLSLLFVPAGAGVMLHLARLGEEWLAIVLALLGSTALALLVTARVFRWLATDEEH